MGLADDLSAEVSETLRHNWSTRAGTVVPADNSIMLGNDAIQISATVLYADLADSTHLVENYKNFFAAEMYKTFLRCAAKIIRSEGGSITAYDGDRIMAVYMDNEKNTSAVRTAMKISYAVAQIIKPNIQRQYTNNQFDLRHVVGIDTSELFVARAGVRGANDLVWIGRAANCAAKLAALPDSYPTYITADVYDGIHETCRVSPDGQSMWEAVSWNTFDGRTIYRSTWWWSLP
jgi:class 3 adenylate cyclase